MPAEATTSTTYTALTTPGPIVTVITGTSAVVWVTSALLVATGTTDTAYMSFAVSGATTLASSDVRAVWNPGAASVQNCACFYVSGLTAGSNVFTAQYRTNNAGNAATFQDRNLVVQPLG